VQFVAFVEAMTCDENRNEKAKTTSQANGQERRWWLLCVDLCVKKTFDGGRVRVRPRSQTML
jgi:hypothetical protein